MKAISQVELIIKALGLRRIGTADAKKMTTAETIPDVDWTQCELIERVPGKVSGRPVVRGTRIMPHGIVGSFDLGETIEELHAGFPRLSIDQIQRLIIFARAQPERRRK